MVNVKYIYINKNGIYKNKYTYMHKYKSNKETVTHITETKQTDDRNLSTSFN